MGVPGHWRKTATYHQGTDVVNSEPCDSWPLFGKMSWREGRESCWGEKIGWGKEEWG